MNSNLNNTPARDLDFDNLDQVVGGGSVMVERRLTGDTTDPTDARKQEQSEK